jgi:hypothetical protein
MYAVSFPPFCYALLLCLVVCEVLQENHVMRSFVCCIPCDNARANAAELSWKLHCVAPERSAMRVLAGVLLASLPQSPLLHFEGHGQQPSRSAV